MRGGVDRQVTMLTAITPGDKAPKDHPIREIKAIVDRALRRISPTFNTMYAKVGRPSMPPEHLLKGCLLIALYSIRNERQSCERLEYDLLFKWFPDLNIEDPAFAASTFSKNKERLLGHDVARRFFVAVREALKDGGGSEIKHTGDGIMASFPTAPAALACAIAIQRAVHAAPESPLARPAGEGHGGEGAHRPQRG